MDDKGTATTAKHPGVLAQRVKVTALRPGPNTRKTVDKDLLAELTASVRADGVLQSLLVRPDKEPGTYRVIDGHRRFAAAQAAGLTDVPVLVLNTDGDDVERVSVVLNIMREDLNPMDEAAVYAHLVESGAGVADIAAKVGKSRAHVAQRLVLNDLPVSAAKAVRSGELPVRAALVIARIPNKRLRDEAAKSVLSAMADREISPSQVASALLRDYTLALGRECPFDSKDAALTPAGPCAVCPKRTGNARDLFGDVPDNDLCTDPVCFKAKSDAMWKKACADAKAKGVAVLSDAETEKLFPYAGSSPSKPWTNIDDHAFNIGDGKKTHRALLKGHDGPPLAIARLATGHVVTLTKTEDLVRCYKTAGVLKERDAKAVESLETRSDKARDEMRAQREKARIEALVGERTNERIVAGAVKSGVTSGVLDVLLAGVMAGSWADTIKAVGKRRDWHTKGGDPHAEFVSKAKTLKGNDLLGLVVELMVVKSSYGTDSAQALACALFDVDVAKVRVEVKAEDAAAKAKPKKESKPKANKTTKAKKE